MSLKTIREDRLTRSEVDVISEQIEMLLEKSGQNKTDRLRTKLMMEDIILNICERFGEDTTYTLYAGTVFGRQFIRLCYTGESFDPNIVSDDPSENWSRRIMSEMGLSPVWQYRNGVNTLELKLKRKSIGSLGAILISIALAVILGAVGAVLLSDSAKETVSGLVFEPLQKMFLDLLSVFSGFLILLSVSCGIFNMGNVSSFSKMGRVMFMRFIGFTLLIAAFVSIGCYFLFPPVSVSGDTAGAGETGLSDIFGMIYDIVPGDPVTPFMNGNAMQIVLIGIIVGVTVLVLGEKANGIKSVAEELNNMVSSILSGVCKMIPGYVFLVLINMIWSGTYKQLLNIWKPMVTMVAIDIAFLAAVIVYFCIRYRVSVGTIVRKLLPTFMKLITTASTIGAFSETIEDGTAKFGIDKKYMKVAHPIRAIVFMPGLATEFAVLIYSMAQLFSVEIGLIQIIMGILIITILTVAVPPIAGSVAMVFGILFTQMGIPVEAIALAVTCDVFYDFLDCAINNSVGILECAMQADKFGMLDHDVLKKQG